MELELPATPYLYQIAFAAFVAFVFRVAARVCNKSLTDIILTAYVVFCGSIIVSGFVLSELNLIASRRAWAIAVFIPAFIFYIQFTRLFGRERQESFTMFEVIGERVQFFFTWFWSLRGYLKVIYTLLVVTFLIIAITNLLLVMYTVPNEWDSMTGHLTRLMYYMQRGNMHHFGGTNWNIDTYPRSVCTIQIYSYLLSGKIENFFKLIHHVAYWICGIGAFGIAQRISKNFAASFFCGIVMWLLPNVLMQSTTTETDIVLCSYLTCLVYFLFTYRNSLKRRYLYLAGMVFGIALGHKITFVLLLPSVGVIILYTFFWGVGKSAFKLRIMHLAIGAIIGIGLFTLPTGYIGNIRLYGHPIGPPTALKHQSIERAGDLSTWAGRKNLLKQGSRNVVRYGFDFFNMDGFRNTTWGNAINRTIKKPFIFLERHSPLRLESETNFTILPFEYERRFEFYNANPYYGIFGFGLMLPLLVLTLIGVIRSRVHVFLAIAFLLHFAALSFSAAYDPWKGRYFQNTAVFAVPFLLLLFTQHYTLLQKGWFLLKSYVLTVTIIGCFSALCTVFLNERSLPFAALGRPSAFDMERIAHQTWARPDITKAYQRFDSLVPQNATVALADINDDFEYPLFGKELTRTIIPINPFEKGLQPIPKEADYLFFAASVVTPQSGDIRLGTDTTMTNLITQGEDYYLRKLRKSK
ncbi:MAG: glycosyltransferase family 39 protein [Spirosomataceae bacterium]